MSTQPTCTTGSAPKHSSATPVPARFRVWNSSGADGAYAGTLARWLQNHRGWRVEVLTHRDRHLWRYRLEEKPKGFQVIPRR
jgi:hypothetical protein